MTNDYPDLFGDIKASPEHLEKLKDYEYAQALYAALCNVDWYKPPFPKPFACSWRYAGHAISDIRNEILDEDSPKENYCDFYCSGIGAELIPEGTVTREIQKDLLALGYYPKA